MPAGPERADRAGPGSAGPIIRAEGAASKTPAHRFVIPCIGGPRIGDTFVHARSYQEPSFRNRPWVLSSCRPNPCRSRFCGPQMKCVELGSTS